VSIIYDALQKTQQARAKEPVLPIKKKWTVNFQRFKRPAYILGLTGALLAVGVAVVYLVQYKWHLFYAAQSHQPMIAEADYRAKHILGGVFVSPTETVAVINTKMVHLGDTLDGMKVASIDTKGVKLQRDQQVIVLSSLM
jgi:hypothetical protein